MKNILDNFIVRVILFTLAFEAIYIGVDLFMSMVVFHEQPQLFKPVGLITGVVLGIVTAIQYKPKK